MFNKRNGVYYTPSALADYLARPLIEGGNTVILDPSYGEGALLLAAERSFEKSRNANSQGIHLFGCDIKPVNGLLKHLPEANLKEIDFFDYPLENKFDAILMNPPYVRHHIQDTKKTDRYREIIPDLKMLDKKADLWAYFLVKSVIHLRAGGSIGAVLPWAFLQADYAMPVRKWLSGFFSEIKIVALSSKYFENAKERVVVLWLSNYGRKCESIKIAATRTIESKTSFEEVSPQVWTSDKVYSSADNLADIISHCKSVYGFTEFSNHADVKIGVVTGAVDYFIMPRASANKIGFSKKRLVPILREASEFSSYIKKGKKDLQVLVALKANDHLKYRKFVQGGVNQKIHKRSHSLRRQPYWYCVDVGKIPDAFFPYRVSKIPYLVFNDQSVQCTNSIHRIYFKGLSMTEQKWIFVSLLSKISQLSVEANSKTYGRALLKMEPKALKNSLVLKRGDKSINAVYLRVVKLLASQKKDEAMNLASEFIYSCLEVEKNLAEAIDRALSQFHELR